MRDYSAESNRRSAEDIASDFKYKYPGVNAEQVVSDTLEYGGSTTFPSGKAPTSGTSVSLPGHENRVPADDFGVTDVMNYMHSPENHAKLTGRPNRALGMWKDNDESGNPQVFQDVSRIFKDTPRSNRLARTSAVGGNQMGIYNLETFTTEYNPTHPDVLKRAGGNVELDPGEAKRYTTSEAPVGTEVVTGATTETQKFSRGRGRKKAVVPAGQGTFIFTGAGSQLQPPPTTKK
jgi:hypothetical protein